MIFASALFTLIFGTLFIAMCIATVKYSEDTREYVMPWWTFLILFAISGGVLTEKTNFFNCDRNQAQTTKEIK